MPRSAASSPRLPWVAGALLVLLLGALAVLQLRWLGEVAVADRQRLDAAGGTAMAAFAADVDREVSRAWLVFRPPAGGDRAGLAALAERWQEAAPDPRLVEDLVLETGGSELRLRDGAWVTAADALPEELERAGAHRRHPFFARRGGGRLRRDLTWRPVPLLRPDLPGLEVPVADTGDDRLWVVFDRGYLSDRLLPALVRRHLEPVLGPGLAARVTARASGEVLYATAPALAGPFEWSQPLFDLLPADDLHRLAFALGAPAEEVAPVGRPEAVRGGPRRFAARGASRRRRGRPGPPLLEARPARAPGSLAAALGRARRGNAALVFGILLLLALAAAALALSTRRAQQMARRQLEFTAAVSHELRTPLAAIRSLADNLADGLVREPEQARRYGAQIARQGERLTEMVEEVLALAAQRSGGRRERVRLDPGSAGARGGGGGRGRAPRRAGGGRGGAGPASRRRRPAVAAARSRQPGRQRPQARRPPALGGGRGAALAAPRGGRAQRARPGPGHPRRRARSPVRALLPRPPRPRRAGPRKRPRPPPGAPGGRGARRPRRGALDGGRQHLRPGAARVPGGAVKRRILIVEDAEALRLSLSDRLESEGYEVALAADGDAGFERARAEPFDLLLLDVMLPGRSGFDLLRDLRREGVSAPVLLLTARDEVVDRVLGLKLGADDYLVKPFATLELLARIEALLRRAQPDTEGGSFAFGEVRVDFRRMEVTRGGRAVDLSALEFRLLRYLVAHPGEVLSRDRLLDEVWGYGADVYSRTVDQHVATLRRKIEVDPRHPRHVVTVHGAGYRFEP